MKKLLALLLTLVVAVALIGCGGKEDDSEVKLTGIKLTLNSTVEVDETITGKVQFTPSDATNKNLKWSSDNEKVAKVSQKGVVTGVAAGEATITVTSEADANIKDSVKVTVTEAQGGDVALTGLSFSEATAKVGVESTLDLRTLLAFEPADATDKEVVWSSDDSTVAAVVDGIVQGIAEGSTTIKATAKNNNRIFAEITITVDSSEPQVYVTKIQMLTEGVSSIYVAETKRFSLSFNDSNTENRPTSYAVEWTSSDDSIATVDDKGYITGVAGGHVTITVTALGVEPGKEGTVKDTVELDVIDIVVPTSFTAAANSVELKPGTGTNIVVSVEPSNGDKRATFESSDETIATVDENGAVTTFHGVQGTVIITVTSTADPTFIVTITLTIKEQDEIIDPESVEIKGEETMYVGEAYAIKLVAIVLPSTAPQGVTWTSNNESVATVDEFGVVTGLKVGTARIRATSTANPEIQSKFFAIKVVEYVAHEPADLKGYEIIIMNAASALGDIDPFLDNYTQSDKSYKQEAWTEVQENFNCKISVVAYPDEAPWGDKRVQWLITNATNGTSQCDLGTISTNWLYRFAEENGNAGVDVTDYYIKYGESQMSTILKEAGSFHQKIYVASTGISPVSVNVDFGLYYNLALLEKLNLENPAKLFNEGKWTYSKFTEWVKNAQAQLGDAEDAYALAGHPYYYWFGLTNAAGIKVADTTATKVNISTTRSKEASAMMRDLYESGCVDPIGSWCESSSDNNAWFKGNTVMVTGYLWFVKNDNRWYKTVFGEDTRFGYVPFPYPDDMPKENTRISSSGLSAYLYVKGRQYPAGVTIEGVYQAVNQMYLDTIKKQKADPLFDANAVLNSDLSKRIDDPESIEAIKFFDSNRLFFDPCHALYTSTSATPLKTPAVNVMMNGEDYDEQYDAVYSQYETDFLKIFG